MSDSYVITPSLISGTTTRTSVRYTSSNFVLNTTYRLKRDSDKVELGNQKHITQFNLPDSAFTLASDSNGNIYHWISDKVW
jgi:hypothetical protein